MNNITTPQYHAYFRDNAYNKYRNLFSNHTKVYGMMSFFKDIKIINQLKNYTNVDILTNNIDEYSLKTQQLLLSSGLYKSCVDICDVCNQYNKHILYTHPTIIESEMFVHNKFLVFDNEILVTGSLNLSGEYNSLDNIIVTNDSKLIEEYESEFSKIYYQAH